MKRAFTKTLGESYHEGDRLVGLRLDCCINDILNLLAQVCKCNPQNKAVNTGTKAAVVNLT